MQFGSNYFLLRFRDRQTIALIFLIALAVLAFWVWELSRALERVSERQEQALKLHQERALERKAETLYDVFHEVYNSTRTIAQLPMIRSITGENRISETEDVVSQGRMSLDAHRTVQQIYTNLQHNVQVSEVYYVLDGFDPQRNVPFFMYDQLIAGAQPQATQEPQHASATDDHPPESEESEYQHFPVQLNWFRQHAPHYVWQRSFNAIPIQLSPVMRTCDNSQFVSLRHGDVRETNGFIFAMPVYDLEQAHFKGMITAVLRTNAIEALLVGVPFIPITTQDVNKQAQQGWSMPGPAPFLLRQREYGVTIFDRRNAAIADRNGQAAQQGRWARISIALHPGSHWELSHFLSAKELNALKQPFQLQYRQTIYGRLGLLAVFLAFASLAFMMMRRTQRELFGMAHYDPLTDLPNRRLFLDTLARGIARSKRTQNKLALLFIDIAGFNAINDAIGTHCGDQLLIDISNRLLQTVRSTDTVLPARDTPLVSRLGGDQFTIICEDIDHISGIASLIERILTVLHQPFNTKDQTVDLQVHIGVAVYPDDASLGEKLLTCADGAMHEARRQNVSHFIFNTALRERSSRLHTLSAELARALERDQFRLYYQPKANLDNGHIVSLEALLRWQHPELGLISPVEFIPILENSGGIIAVGQWVLEQACRDLARLQQEGFTSLMISANVSVRQLRLGNLHETVAHILTEFGTNPHQLVLEVTESMMMENLTESGLLLNKLDQLGTRIAIDDFGTGYSSLTYLQHLPLAYLKLDKSFIDGMTNPRAKHIVKSVIDLAHGLSLKTIAEGIETDEQRDLLTTLGCDIMQGYLLSRPLPLPDIIAWLRQRP